MAKEPIKYESALPALLQSLIPQTEKTTSSANTGPLEQIFGQQQASSTPEGMAALIQQLFTQGAQAVPALTGAYANATGSRSSNNSGLALSLAELNKTLAGQAAGLVGQQQSEAAKTAAAIAQATRGASTTRGADPTMSLLTGLGGTALNWADKNKLLDPLKTGIKGLFDSGATAASAATDFAGSGTLDSFQGLGADFGAADALSFLDSGGFDLGNSIGYDFADLGSSLFTDSLSADFGSTASDVGSSLFDSSDEWISSFFADGGYVDAKKLQEHAASVKQSYADGGVVRNKNQMGKPVQQQGRTAKNYSGYSQPSAAGGPTTTSAILTERQGGDATTPFTGAGTPEQNQAMLGSMGISALGMINPLAAMAVSQLTGVKSAQSMLARMLTNQLGLTSPALGRSVAGRGEADPAVKAGTTDALTGFLALNDNFGTSDSGSGLGVAGMGDAGPGGSSGDAAAAGGSAATGPGEFANGGEVDGKGTGISDSITAKLSDGEFVTSADVVAQPGVRQLLEALQQQFHTPAAMQRMHGKR